MGGLQRQVSPSSAPLPLLAPLHSPSSDPCSHGSLWGLRRTCPGSRPAWGQGPGRVDSSVGPAHLLGTTVLWPASAMHQQEQHIQSPRCPEEMPALGPSHVGPCPEEGAHRVLVSEPETCRGKAHDHPRNNNSINSSSFRLAQGPTRGCPPSRLHPKQLPGGLLNPYCTGQETEVPNEEPKPTQPGRGGSESHPEQSPSKACALPGRPSPSPLPVPGAQSLLH